MRKYMLEGDVCRRRLRNLESTLLPLMKKSAAQLLFALAEIVRVVHHFQDVNEIVNLLFRTINDNNTHMDHDHQDHRILPHTARARSLQQHR